MVNKIKSHKSVENIAKRHRLDVSFIEKQLEMGIPIEHEHTRDKDLATDIALQHLDEIPDYYTRLKKMEASAKKEHKKFKDVKENCGCEEDAVKDLENQLKTLSDVSYKSIDKLMRRIMKEYDMTAKQLHDAFVNKNNKTPDSWIKEITTMKEEKSLRTTNPCWKGYKPVGVKKKNGKKVPNCVPVKESMGIPRYCPKCKKDESQSECKYGPMFWAMYSTPSMLTTNQMKYDIAQIHPANESKEPDHEHSMARSELSTVISAAKRLRGKLKGEGNIEAWVQSKITKAADYLDSAADYIDSGEMNVEGYSNWRSDFGLNEDWQKVNRQDKTDGLSPDAVKAYRSENPGSKLQTAVTEKKPTGKKAERRKSFCRRMGGMKSKLTSAETARDPDSRINKALRRWNCN